MKNNLKMKKYILFFSIILGLPLATLYFFPNNESLNIEDQYNKTNMNLKTAAYWDLTGTPIDIDDSIPTKNWSYTASTYDWCSGSGTWYDPFLIENVTIDGQGTDTCLTILNSKTAYFVIRNCTISNSLDTSGNGGIKLLNVNNGILINNTCTLNRAGIYLYSNSDNNTILQNELKDNNWGVYLSVGCGANRISNNTIIDNDQYGIEIAFSSHGNNITNNIVKDNGWGINLEANAGIMIQESNDNIIFDNEIISNNQNGVYVYDDICYDNIIINNNISDNKKGIRMAFNVFGTIVTDNFIKDNTQYGIYISTYHPQGSDIYLNWFIDNGIQAYDNGPTNDWDNGIIGNFWSDYPGVDADDNGIGDAPYLIGGDYGGAQDNYPIWYDSPNIEILSPQPSEIFQTSAPPFNVSINDPNLDSMWYTLNNGMQKVLFTANESVNQGLWDALSDGPIIISFYANDSVGNVNSSSVTVIKDTGGPNIHITSPNQNDVFGYTAPAFNVEIKDTLLDTTWYTINGGVTKYIFTVNESLNSAAWDSALDGPVGITFFANDTLAHQNSASVSVIKERFLPIILIISPNYGAEFNTTAPNFIVEFDEANPVEMWYHINESLTKYTFTANGTINQAAWDALSEGELMLNFSIKDIAGNVVFDIVIITRTLPPTDGNGGPEIYSYPLILVITAIWIMSTIILISIKKNIKKK